MYLAIYLFTIVDSLRLLTGTITVISGIALLFSVVDILADDRPDHERAGSVISVGKWVLIPSLLLTVLLPGKEGLAMIYIIPKLAESSVIQKDVPELYDIAIKVLKKNLQESIESK